MAHRKIVGIDLGTTYSAIAHFDEHGRPAVIPNSDNERTTPSVILFEDGRAVVGKQAKALAVGNPKRVIQFVKDHMGDADWTRDIDGYRFTPEVLSAMILKRLVLDAEDQLGEKITDAVITCPAYFNDNERRRTMEAGRLAGLNVLGILNEPTAAAIAYGLNNLDKRVKALVFDLGGGTLDVTILEINGNDVRVLATDGERQLGGKDWDEVLVDYLAVRFLKETGIDPRKNPDAFQDLILRAEEAKRALTPRSKTKILVSCEGHSVKIEVSKQEFEALTEPLLDRVEWCLEQTLKKAKLEWSDIDTVLKVGGSTRMPQVQRMLLKHWSGEQATWVNPDESVAIGAVYWGAIQRIRQAKREEREAARQARRAENTAAMRVAKEVPSDMFVLLSDSVVFNVNSHALGVVTVEDDGGHSNRVMIPEQTLIPHQVTQEFTTAFHGQRSVEVRILEGDDEDPDACIDIGRCVISDLPKDRPRGFRIAVTYRYDEDGVIDVSAEDLQTGKEVATRILRTADVLPPEEADLQARRVAHLLESGMGSDMDSDERVYREFMEAEEYGDLDY